MWDERSNTRNILRDDIQRRIKSETGRELNNSALDRAVNVAEEVWKGDTPCVTAVNAGLAAVKNEIFKPNS